MSPRLLLSLLIVVSLSSYLSAQPDRFVVLVIIDGARYSETLGDDSYRYVPEMGRLNAAGVIVEPMLNDGATVTRRGIPAIWSGSWAVPNDTTLPSGYSSQYATAPTMWEYLRKQKGVDSTQALYVIKDLSTPWLQSYHPDYGPDFWPWYVLHGNTDRDVWAHARSLLIEHHPMLSVIYLADVDGAGHSGNWTTYTSAILTADSIVGEVWDLLETDTVFAGRSTLKVTNDHGRHLDGVSNGFAGHGDACMGCRQVMMLAIGEAVKQGVRSSIQRSLTDIAPTIGSILGFSTPLATGTSMEELLASVTRVDRVADVPDGYVLRPGYPNPFNPTTTVSFSVPARSRVRIDIVNLLGQSVAVLLDDILETGSHARIFDARDLPSGIYVARMFALAEESGGGTFRAASAMILIR